MARHMLPGAARTEPRAHAASTGQRHRPPIARGLAAAAAAAAVAAFGGIWFTQYNYSAQFCAVFIALCHINAGIPPQDRYK